MISKRRKYEKIYIWTFIRSKSLTPSLQCGTGGAGTSPRDRNQICKPDQPSLIYFHTFWSRGPSSSSSSSSISSSVSSPIPYWYIFRFILGTFSRLPNFSHASFTVFQASFYTRVPLLRALVPEVVILWKLLVRFFHPSSGVANPPQNPWIPLEPPENRWKKPKWKISNRADLGN